MTLFDCHEFICGNVVEKRRQFDTLSHLQLLQKRMKRMLHLREEGNLFWHRKIVPYPRFDDSSGHDLLPVPFGITGFVVFCDIQTNEATIVLCEGLNFRINGILDGTG